MEAASGIPVRARLCSGMKIRRALTRSSGFDRDLSIAGRVMVRTTSGSICQRLVKIDRPSR